MSVESINLTVEGMTCGHCENFVKMTLEDLEGVLKVSADHQSDAATVEFDNALVSPQQMLDAVNETHYKAKAGA